MKNNIQQLKNNIQQLKNTWSIQNAPLVIMVILYVAVFFSINPITIPSTVMAYEAITAKEEVSTEALLEKYYQEELVKAENELRIRATRRLFDELGTHAVTLNPYLTGE